MQSKQESAKYSAFVEEPVAVNDVTPNYFREEIDDEDTGYSNSRLAQVAHLLTIGSSDNVHWEQLAGITEFQTVSRFTLS